MPKGIPDYKSLLDIDILDFNKLNKIELKGIVQKLGKVANTRIRNLRKADIETPASKYKLFSIKGKNIQQLRNEYMRAKQFLNLKSSTIRGAKSIMRSFVTRITYKSPTKHQIESLLAGSMKNSSRFWHIINKLYELNPKLHTMEYSQCIKFQSKVANILAVDYKAKETNLDEDTIAQFISLQLETESGFSRFIDESSDTDIENVLSIFNEK